MHDTESTWNTIFYVFHCILVLFDTWTWSDTRAALCVLKSVFLLDPPCPPAAAVSRETVPLASSYHHRSVSAVCCKPAGHPCSQHSRHLRDYWWDIRPSSFMEAWMKRGIGKNKHSSSLFISL